MLTYFVQSSPTVERAALAIVNFVVYLLLGGVVMPLSAFLAGGMLFVLVALVFGWWDIRYGRGDHVEGIVKSRPGFRHIVMFAYGSAAFVGIGLVGFATIGQISSEAPTGYFVGLGASALLAFSLLHLTRRR